jgi:hypothetical protein
VIDTFRGTHSNWSILSRGPYNYIDYTQVRNGSSFENSDETFHDEQRQFINVPARQVRTLIDFEIILAHFWCTRSTMTGIEAFSLVSAHSGLPQSLLPSTAPAAERDNLGGQIMPFRDWGNTSG